MLACVHVPQLFVDAVSGWGGGITSVGLIITACSIFVRCVIDAIRAAPVDFGVTWRRLGTRGDPRHADIAGADAGYIADCDNVAGRDSCAAALDHAAVRTIGSRRSRQVRLAGEIHHLRNHVQGGNEQVRKKI